MKERISQTNVKFSRNQALQQKSHQRGKYQGSCPCKILGTLLKMVKGKRQANGPENKKIEDNAQGFISERCIDRLYVQRKEGGKEHPRIKGCVYTSIQGLEDDIKKSKERLIVAASNSIDNARTNRTTRKTGKQR